MRGALVFLLLAVFLQNTRTIKELVKVKKETGSQDGPSFWDSLTEDGSHVATTFGFEMLQSLHSQRLHCNMKLSSADLKYSKHLETLLDYHLSMEKLVSVPKFENISNVDRPSIEANYHQTLQHMERIRNEDLKRIGLECAAKQREWLETKLESAVAHARDVIENHPGQYSQYRRMMAQVKSHKARLEEHLVSCRSRDAFELLYCYADELEVMLQEIGKYLEAMRHIVLVYMDLEDDEDLAMTGSGNGNEHETTPPVPVPVTDVELPGNAEVHMPNRRPTHIPPKKADPPNKATPTSAREISTTASKPPPTTQQLDITSEGSSPAPSTSSEGSPAPSERSPAPSTSSEGSPSVISTQATEHASEEVLGTKEKRPGGGGGGADGGKRKGSKSQGTGTGDDRVEVEGRFDEGGEEVDISLELDLGNPEAGPEGIILDPQTPPPDHEGDAKEQGWGQHHYILVFLFLTIGVVITTLVIIVVVVVAARRTRRRDGGVRYQPLISEKEMLDVMKKTGYVNPTYKFYTQT